MNKTAIETIAKLIETEQNKGEIIGQLLYIYGDSLQANYEEYKTNLEHLKQFDQELTKAVASLDSAFQYQRQLRTQLFTEAMEIEKNRLDRETEELRQRTDRIVALLSRQSPQKRQPTVDRIIKFLTGLRR